MVLITLSGYPTSGKTHRARQLERHLTALIAEHSSAPAPATAESTTAEPTTASEKRAQRAPSKLVYISDHTLQIPRSAYGAAGTEKTARAELFSAAKRALGRDTVVLLDSGNYIKGWRYQLHCEAKAVGVRSCVVHVGAPADEARKANEERLRRAQADGERTAEDETVGGAGEASPYDAAVWSELTARFEEPNAFARWDSPLYTLVWAADDDAAVGAVARQIWDEVVCGRARDGRSLGPVRMNAATVLNPAGAPDFLYELEKTTQGVVATVLQAQRDAGLADAGGGGGEVDVQVEQGDKVIIHLPATAAVSVAQMQRLRRQFVQLHRQQMGQSGGGAVGKGGGGLSRERVARLFVDYLNDSFEKA